MVLILKDAVNPKEFLTVDHHAVLLVKVRIHNHVRNSCLIFQTQKDEALRRSRTLPSDYTSCYPRVLSVLHRSEEHTSELQSRFDLVCRLLLEKQKSRFEIQKLKV